MPQIAHIQVEKLKSSLPWEGDPPPTPSPRSVATLPRAWSLRSLAKIVPPNVLPHYATFVCSHHPCLSRSTCIAKHTSVTLKTPARDAHLDACLAAVVPAGQPVASRYHWSRRFSMVRLRCDYGEMLTAVMTLTRQVCIDDLEDMIILTEL